MSGSLQHYARTTLTVLGAPDFSISTSPLTVTVVPGGTAIDTAVVSVSQGFTGTVGLSASGLPAGVTASFNPPSITGSGLSTVTFTAASSAALGSTFVTVSGQSGSVTHASLAYVTVATPAPGTMLSPSKTR
ncbi:MAG: hypothetical protein ACLQVN_00735 [Bryobacteraceae bacterium]